MSSTVLPAKDSGSLRRASLFTLVLTRGDYSVTEVNRVVPLYGRYLRSYFFGGHTEALTGGNLSRSDGPGLNLPRAELRR